MYPALISVAELATRQAQQQPLIILDARARLNDADAGQALWHEGHIPGAFHTDMDRDLSAPASARHGRHPLPAKEAFATRLREWGITADDRVVVYDDNGGRLAAARAWWLLRWAGHPAVQVLDGGWQAWLAAGQPIQTDTPLAKASDWQPHFDDTLIASANDAAAGEALLLDARAAERYRGEAEPLDPKAGHIPGARNVPGSSLLQEDHTFLPAAQLQQQLPAAENVIAYCGSGISACQLILGYAQLERPLPRLYPGSWSAWSNDPQRPVATGDE